VSRKSAPYYFVPLRKMYYKRYVQAKPLVDGLVDNALLHSCLIDRRVRQKATLNYIDLAKLLPKQKGALFVTDSLISVIYMCHINCLYTLRQCSLK